MKYSCVNMNASINVRLWVLSTSSCTYLHSRLSARVDSVGAVKSLIRSRGCISHNVLKFFSEQGDKKVDGSSLLTNNSPLRPMETSLDNFFSGRGWEISDKMSRYCNLFKIKNPDVIEKPQRHLWVILTHLFSKMSLSTQWMPPNLQDCHLVVETILDLNHVKVTPGLSQH